MSDTNTTPAREEPENTDTGNGTGLSAITDYHGQVRDGVDNPEDYLYKDGMEGAPDEPPPGGDLSGKKSDKPDRLRETFEAETPEELAATFAAMRERQKVSQDKVAAKTKLTQRTIDRIEGDGSNPTHKTMVQAAAAYGYRVKVIFEPM